jgi:hypothetical protein
VLPHEFPHTWIEGELLPLGVRDEHPVEELVCFA